MTPSVGFARIGLSSARWVLPWVAVLFVSLTLAYAMGSAIRGGASASDQQSEVHAALSRGDAAAPTNLEQSSTPLTDTAIEVYGSKSGVKSRTSPASTGHASPAGCCTWD